MPRNDLPSQLELTFLPIIWIFFTGDGIKSMLAFEIFSTLAIAKELKREVGLIEVGNRHEGAELDGG